MDDTTGWKMVSGCGSEVIDRAWEGLLFANGVEPMKPCMNLQTRTVAEELMGKRSENQSCEERGGTLPMLGATASGI